MFLPDANPEKFKTVALCLKEIGHWHCWSLPGTLVEESDDELLDCDTELVSECLKTLVPEKFKTTEFYLEAVKQK